jgi:hypothetical protein
VGGEGVESDECFEGRVNTVTLDVAVKETPDLILRGPSPEASMASRMRSAMGSPVDLPKRREALE